MIHCPTCNQKKSYGRTIVHLCDYEIAFYGRMFEPASHEYQWNCHRSRDNSITKRKNFISPLILFEKSFVATLYE